MASLTHDKTKQRCRIVFVAPDGSRKCLSISQGKAEKEKGLLKRAHSLLSNVESLIELRTSGKALDNSLLKWIEGLKPNHRKTLVASGLIEDRSQEAEERPGLFAFADQWLVDHPAGSGTENVRKRAVSYLKKHFTADTQLEDVTAYDAECYGIFLRQQPGRGTSGLMAESTARKMMQIANQIGRAAAKAGFISESPFSDEPTTPPEKDASKKYYIPDAEIRKIYKACDSMEWKALLILGRYAGLRLPSEIQSLRWDSIDWKAGLMTVVSPKLKGKKKHIRQVPLFPQVRTVLEKLWSENPEEHVLPTIHRMRNINPQLRRMVKAAGVTPWPDIAMNLRRSAIMDALRNDKFTPRNLTDWFGNSDEVRQKHYDDTLESDIRNATEGTGEQLDWITESATQSKSVAPVSQQGSESGCNASHGQKENPGFSGACESLQCAAEGMNGGSWTPVELFLSSIEDVGSDLRRIVDAIGGGQGAEWIQKNYLNYAVGSPESTSLDRPNS